MARDMDGFGRPALLEDRLAVISSNLAAEGQHQAPAIIQCMAWWEEGMSPVLGCEVSTSGFVRTADGPHSEAVAEVLERWQSAGSMARHTDYHPELSGSMDVTSDVLDRSDRFRTSNSVLRPLELAPRDCRPWWNLVDFFLRGLTYREVGTLPRRGEPHQGIGHSDPVGDFRRCMSCDPAYILSGWEEAGPAAAMDDLGRIGVSDLAGRTGNPAAALLEWRMDNPPPDARLEKPWQAAFYHGLYLARAAARRYPDDYGDSGYYEAFKELVSSREDLADGSVRERFYTQDGQAAGSITWQILPGQASGVQASSWAEAGLLGIEIAPGHRASHIGTCIVRHAMTRNCRIAPPPLPGAERLWGLHGNPQEDGRYKLVRTMYSLVQARERAPAHTWQDVPGVR